MVYTALQLVTRGREGGISVVDLGKKSGYDQKTCFYLVKQLLDMDLVYVLDDNVICSAFYSHIFRPQCESQARGSGLSSLHPQVFL